MFSNTFGRFKKFFQTRKSVSSNSSSSSSSSPPPSPASAAHDPTPSCFRGYGLSPRRAPSGNSSNNANTGTIGYFLHEHENVTDSRHRALALFTSLPPVASSSSPYRRSRSSLSSTSSLSLSSSIHTTATANSASTTSRSTTSTTSRSTTSTTATTASSTVLKREYIMGMRVSDGVRDALLRMTQGVCDLDLDFSDRDHSILSESTSSLGSNSEREACKNEREEIRRRLAMADDDDVTLTSGPDDLEMSPRNSSLRAKLRSTHNMQICFMNDDLLDDDDDDDDEDVSATLDSEELSNRMQVSTTSTQPESDDNSTLSESNTVPVPNHPCHPGEIAHFTSRQSQLQTEATIALAQASTMAHMQLEVEKQSKKKSPIADMVGIPTLGKGRKLKLSYNKLNEMNIAQLQVLVNDLHTQIELLNEDLVHLLIERDDLHMEQDSMLVDIEDLTSHCQDPKTTNNNKSSHDNNRPSSRRDRFK